MAIALHNKLLTDIADMMDTQSGEYESFVFHMTQFVPKGILNSKRNLLEKFNAMKSKGKLDVGKYESLKKVARDSGNNDVLELIEEREPEILKEIEPKQSSSTVINVGIKPNYDRGQSIIPSTSSQSTSRTAGRQDPEGSNQQGQSSATIFERTGKKRKLEEAKDLSDPLYDKDKRGRGQYYTDGKTGFLLIVNCERTGVESDVNNLNAFFGKELGFDVETLSGELTADDVWKGLDKARRRLNGDTNRHYYAFVCAILSQGNEVGIVVKGESGKNVTIPSAQISKFFCNSDKMSNFTGRPRLFFIQSCLGQKVQKLHEVRDEDDAIQDESDDIQDESDDIYVVPEDADTFFAFANIPGYGIGGDLKGSTNQKSCFIHALMEVFRSHYKTEHVEDMLISVREMVALGDKKNNLGNKRTETKEMPFTWSTLTKRLYFRPLQA